MTETRSNFMTAKTKHAALAAFFGAAVGLASGPAAAQDDVSYISIGTGGPTGVYFVVGNAV
jgi:TRAP-type uncharacterized transport system substrate-binding protein